MYVRAVRKKNRGSEQVYSYHQRMEAVRTPRGPRQTTDPKPFHLEIYRALGLPPKLLKTKRLRV
jgi:hypothetical protein